MLDAVGLAHLLEREKQSGGGSRPRAASTDSNTGTDDNTVALLPMTATSASELVRINNDAGDTVGKAPETMLARWSAELSHGERQRLAFARLFYWQPAVAGTLARAGLPMPMNTYSRRLVGGGPVLDEATSAVDPAMACALLDRCRALGITVVSVAHAPDVVAWHARRLHLTGEDGGWTLDPA